MSFVRLLDKHIEEIILIVLSILTVVIVFLQVVMRYVFADSLVWSEELARYAFIWMIYIGVSYGVKKRRHISVEVFLLYMKPKGKYFLSIAANLLFLIFAALVTYYSIEIVESVQRLSPALEISMKWIYAAPLVGMALSSIRIIQNMVENHRAYQAGETEGLL